MSRIRLSIYKYLHSESSQESRTSNVWLDTKPNHSHNHSVKNRPEWSPDSKGCSSRYGKWDMVNSSNPARKIDEAGRNEISHPDTDPRLPPGQAILNHWRGNHPCILSAISVSSFFWDVYGERTIFNESATQKATKLSHFHWRRSGSTVEG